MADDQGARVAVYLDFDNIVMSWYDRVHGRNSYQRDRQRIAENPSEPEIAGRLGQAKIDVGAIIDYAASFGTLVLTRAYADWSSPVNALYRTQLVARAVDLVQLFPAAAYAKNGADIRLAVDAVEDMFRLPDLTHVVIVGGDSDYVPLAQRCKRLGRYVIGIGVAGSTAKSLAAACDEFEAYDSLPGVEQPAARPPRAAREPSAKESAPKESTTRESKSTKAAADKPEEESDQDAPVKEKAPTRTGARRASSKQPGREEPSRTVPDSLFLAPDAPDPSDPGDDSPDEDPQDAATSLLERALRLGHDKDDAEWLHSSAVKTHMRRMDPSFSEKALGYRSFSDFVKARDTIAELEETGHERLVRLLPSRL